MHKDITGDVVRNLLTLRRLENGLGRSVVAPFVRDLYDDILATVARLDPTAVNRRAFRLRRLERLIKELDRLYGPHVKDVTRAVRAELAAIGKQQAGWAADTLSSAVGPSVTIGVSAPLNLFKAVLDEDPIQGRHLRTWFRDLGESTRRNVTRQVRLGFAQNETIDDIVRRVRGRSAGGGRFVGGAMHTTTRQARAIVRTSVTHIANAGHLETYGQNADVLTGVEYTATLDSRTSDVCIALDGKVWPVGSDDIRTPPQHVNCRSILVPVVDWRGLGLEPPAEGRRASADGPVPSSTTYADWLRDQSVSEQDAILGRARADLFRSGKLDLRGLVNAEGRSLTVAELRARG